MIAELALADALYVAHNMREDDFREVMATRWNDSCDAFAMDAVNYPGPKYAVMNAQNQPVVIGGVALQTPGVGCAWLVATPEINDVIIELSRFSRKLFRTLLDDGLVHRIQASSADFHADAHKWLEMLGFEQEGEPRQAYGKNGEDFLTFVMLKQGN